MTLTKKEIKDYKVIGSSQVDKKFFNENIKNFKISGTFKNEFGELFVIFQWKTISSCFLITGDEFGWELGYQVDRNGYCFKGFGFSEGERKEVKNILKKKKR